MDDKGADLRPVHVDCGTLIYSRDQGVNAGGSGTACSAVVFLAHFLPAMGKDRWQRVLLVATGALMSPTSFKQGESIPGIAHSVAVEREIPADLA